MSRHPDVQFIYKPFPEEPADPIRQVISAECPNCVVTDIRLPQLFPVADAVVLDIPSTGLLEALLHPLPVMLYSDPRFTTLRPEARRLLGARVRLVEDPELFAKDLGTWLSERPWEHEAPVDDRFLREYGVHLGDGQSSVRGADAVERVAGYRAETVAPSAAR
jgi:hypothetical protein